MWKKKKDLLEWAGFHVLLPGKNKMTDSSWTDTIPITVRKCLLGSSQDPTACRR
jgi:hypothetical protein